MHLRTTQWKNSDGSVVRYVQLAHHHRKDGVDQAEVLVNLGREDRLDSEGLRRLVTSYARSFRRCRHCSLGCPTLKPSMSQTR